MFDPTAFVFDSRWGYVCRHEGADYHVKPPLRVRLTPLRLEIGIGRSRPCALTINQDGRWQRKWADLKWRLYGRRRFERRAR